ncbi:DUF2590 family protein [Aeromonas enteropelogenes]|uniref:DUF2590 family protein n=1 Tax=Aeromonas enteropelogenes TaxID=29489 RepID=UPI003BA398CD
MTTQLYTDILVEDGGWIIDSGGQPRLTSERASIGQDIQHLIMESGLARRLLAERSATLRADVMTEIELLVESDVRLIPGTVAVIELNAGLIRVTADTYDFGTVEVIT